MKTIYRSFDKVEFSSQEDCLAHESFVAKKNIIIGVVHFYLTVRDIVGEIEGIGDHVFVYWVTEPKVPLLDNNHTAMINISEMSEDPFEIINKVVDIMEEAK